MGRPCTHESLGGKQGKSGGLVVQTPGAKCGDRERVRRASRAHRGQARHAPRASQACIARAPRASQMRIARAPRTSQTRIVGEPDTHRARIVKALGPWSGAEGYFRNLNYFVFI